MEPAGGVGKWQDGKRAERSNTWGNVPFLMGNLVTLLGWGTGREVVKGSTESAGMMMCLVSSHQLLELSG
jgi:hypothetical protein